MLYISGPIFNYTKCKVMLIYDLLCINVNAETPTYKKYKGINVSVYKIILTYVQTRDPLPESGHERL